MTTENPNKLPSFRARDLKTEARRTEREKRREAMLDGLASGLTHADVAAIFKIGRRTLQREVARCLDQRRAETAEAHARLQTERLNKALRAISVALEEGDIRATKPLLQVLERIDYYQDWVARLERAKAPATLPPRLSGPLAALTHEPGFGAETDETEPEATESSRVNH